MVTLTHSAARLSVVLVMVVAMVTSGCGDQVDQKKFDALYRAGKAVEVDVGNSGSVRVPASEQLLEQLNTEMSLLEGRTAGEKEAAALRAYGSAGEAYKSFLAIRYLDLQGDAVDGRMLLGDGWVAVGSKFNFAVVPAPTDATDKYKFYFVDVGEAVTALLAAVKKDLGEANRLVNAQS
jgi:hypothetical protein